MKFPKSVMESPKMEPFLFFASLLLIYVVVTKTLKTTKPGGDTGKSRL